MRERGACGPRVWRLRGRRPFYHRGLGFLDPDEHPKEPKSHSDRVLLVFRPLCQSKDPVLRFRRRRSRETPPPVSSFVAAQRRLSGLVRSRQRARRGTAHRPRSCARLTKRNRRVSKCDISLQSRRHCAPRIFAHSTTEYRCQVESHNQVAGVAALMVPRQVIGGDGTYTPVRIQEASILLPSRNTYCGSHASHRAIPSSPPLRRPFRPLRKEVSFPSY
ncbi:hypothetical protein B0H10DRAFT_1164503 [Mycena sp. CBHHK59/15]|nr:hypothetical protein B0H10DRAFT_1164503 [Mycena sp. CBHHK59/15]